MATEKRLIVLQDAIDIIVNTPSEIAIYVANGRKKHWTANEALGLLADRQFEIFVLLDNVKKADAAPVVYGQWEDVYGGKYGNKRFRCSICKEKALFKFSQDELLSWHEEQKLSNYCPNCGADMRERKDNGK